MTIPKKYFSSKSIHWNRRYVQICARKHVKWIKIHPEKIIMTLFDFTRFLIQNGTYLSFPWMDFDEKYLFGIVMSYKNFESEICPNSLLNLAPKLKFAENRQGTKGILE
jgi:hypothetical protein